MGHRQSSCVIRKSICLSPVLLWKSGTRLRPKYFLWDVAIRAAGRAGMAPPCGPAAQLYPAVTAARPRCCLGTQTAACLYCRAPTRSSGETWPWNKANPTPQSVPAGSSPAAGLAPRTTWAGCSGRSASRHSLGADGIRGTTCPAHTATASAGIAQLTELWATAAGRVSAQRWRSADGGWGEGRVSPPRPLRPRRTWEAPPHHEPLPSAAGGLSLSPASQTAGPATFCHLPLLLHLLLP